MSYEIPHMKIKKHVCLLAIQILAMIGLPSTASARQGDTLRVQFRVGQSELDLSYANNGEQIEAFVRRAWARYGSRNADELQLNLFTGASPEGPAELNRRLGEQRGISLRNEMQRQLDGLITHITVVNEGARWGALHNMVRASEEPWREDVLKILGKRPADNDWETDNREQLLRRLQGGKVWSELNERYLPKLRSSGSAIIASIKEPVRDTIVIRDTIIYLPEPCPQYEPPIDHSRPVAVKTNLLFCAVAAPNIQLELPLGRTGRWSMEAEVVDAWWIWNHNAHAEQIVNVGLELRYYLGDRLKHHTLDGWHTGLAVAGGLYDIEWKKSDGYQGEYLNTYLNLGYQHRFGRRSQWGIDAGIGFGLFSTKYSHYKGSSIFPEGHEERYDDHLMWQNDGRTNLIAATHANISLAYFFDVKKLFRK